MKVERSVASRTKATEKLPPPSPEEMGVVPWDPPEPPPQKKTRPKPQALAPPNVTLGSVRFSGRAAGVVDAAKEIVRVVKERPVAAAAVLGAAVALNVVASPLMVGVAVTFAVAGVAGVAYHEYKGATAKTAAERERHRQSSGRSLFMAVTSAPLRAFRALRAFKK